MSIDYAEQDRLLDEELRKMYNPQDEDSEQGDQTTPDNSEQVAESPEQPASDEQDLSAESTPVESEQTEQIEEQKPQEATVSEDRYKAAVQAMNAAQRELAAFKKQDAGRDDLIKQLQEQVQQLQEEKQAPAREESTPEMDDSDLEDAKSIYPEITLPLLRRIADLEKKLTAVKGDIGNVKTDVSTVKQVSDRYQKSEQQLAEEKHWDAINNAHPDVDEIVNSPEYDDWYHNVSPGVQQMLQTGTAKDVISALNLYRLDNPKSVPEVKVKDAVKPVAPKVDKLAAAREASSPTVKSGSKPEQKKQTFTREQIEKMSQAEFAEHEDAIDQAFARGEID